MSEPTNTPPKETPPTASPPAEEKAKLDPIVQKIVDSFNMVLDPNVSDDDATPAPEAGAMSISDVVMQRAREKPPEAKPPGEEAPPAPASPEVPPKAEPAPPPPAPEKKDEQPARPPIKLKRKDSVVPDVPVALPVEPPKPAKQEPDEDAAFLQTLSPEEQDELAVAKYAEKAGRQGLYKDTLEYFKKVDKFVRENPDSGVDTEEFRDFTKANRPKWTDAERRKVERLMISDEAAAKVRAELQPVLNQQQAKVREMEAKPIIEHAVGEVLQTLASKPTKEGLEAVNPKLCDMLKKGDYAEAKKRYPVEAPIVQGAVNAAKAWLEIQSDVVAFNPQNQMHEWLANFVSKAGQDMKAQPRTAQIKDGKHFLPLHEYLAAKHSDPDAAYKYWTFSDADVVQLITEHATLEVNNGIQALRAAGFERKPEDGSSKKTESQPAATTTQPIPPTSTDDGSPRAGARQLPGPSVTAPKRSEFEEHIAKLIPGIYDKR